jgi:hypothetical protein
MLACILSTGTGDERMAAASRGITTFQSKSFDMRTVRAEFQRRPRRNRILCNFYRQCSRSNGGPPRR